MRWFLCCHLRALNRRSCAETLRKPKLKDSPSCSFVTSVVGFGLRLATSLKSRRDIAGFIVMIVKIMIELLSVVTIVIAILTRILSYGDQWLV